jgi:hypothetical protein
MFVKELPKALTRMRMYKLYSKHDNKNVATVMININYVPKISLTDNTIIFHLPSHNQFIEYMNPLDAETEYHTIHEILNQ